VVTDTGIGIRKEDLARIFKPFEQVDGTASRRYQGTGLGLSLAKRFAELHGGYLCVESGGELASHEVESRPLDLAFTPDGAGLVVVLGDGTIRLFGVP
jgi:signal transduction histidine kinase